MSGNDEQVECPLCMEPLEIDDINFFPCTCGYQICRFCWHRIRTDENGLCPACRKAYPEDPAEFKPLTEDELSRIKKERRQKDLQRKQKAAENRKHLANVRVVQRNLVFVVGLSARLADTEVLKKHEYFGKYGKIHKVVINQSTSYAGAQGPSASAYVTYNKSDDALKAILAVNNVHIDGRTLKASLGTTKYCSHFLRGTQCPKTDCMYLHELGEEAASFTKEEMQVGKHQEYEQKLLEAHMNSQNTANSQHTSNRTSNRKKANSPTGGSQQTTTLNSQTQQINTQRQNLQTNLSTSPPQQQQQQVPHTANKDAWPSLQQSGNKPISNGAPPQLSTSPDKTKTDLQNRPIGTQKQHTKTNSDPDTLHRITDLSPLQPTESVVPPVSTPSPRQQQQSSAFIGAIGSKRKSLGLDNPESLSLFSSINGYHNVRNPKPPIPTEVPDIPTTEIPETIPVSSSTDWQAAFGFGQQNKNKDWQDDDLGFDPLEESSRGLADLLEKENGQKQNSAKLPHSYDSQKYPGMHTHNRMMPPKFPQNPPPGFSHCQMQPQVQNPVSQSVIGSRTTPMFTPTEVLSSRMMGFVNTPLQNPLHNTYQENVFTDLLGRKDQLQQNAQSNVYDMKDWQEGLRALLPNINISFGSQQTSVADTRPNTSQHTQHQKNWRSNQSNFKTDTQSAGRSWMAYDSAILTSSNPSDGTGLPDSSHWLKSINQLTEMDTPNHRLPFVDQFPMRTPVWPPQTHNPPPGFQTHIRPPLQTTDQHKLAEGL